MTTGILLTAMPNGMMGLLEFLFSLKFIWVVLVVFLVFYIFAAKIKPSVHQLSKSPSRDSVFHLIRLCWPRPPACWNLTAGLTAFGFLEPLSFSFLIFFSPFSFWWSTSSRNCLANKILRAWISGVCCSALILKWEVGHRLPPFSISQCYSWSVSSSDSWAFISDYVFFFEACRILCEMQNTQCSDVSCSLFSSNVLPALWAPLFWKLLIFSAGCFSWLIWFLPVLSLLSRIQPLDLLDWHSDFLRLPISFWKHSYSPCIEFFSLYFLALSLNLFVPVF